MGFTVSAKPNRVPAKPNRVPAKPNRIVPIRMAHFVIRTNSYHAMVAWYRKVLLADVAFANDELTFLAFDEEHHRLAIVNNPDLIDAPPNSTAIDHVAFTYTDLRSLLATYERLKEEGIRPAFCYNHGPTTSLYYADPNANKVELQVDNFATGAEASAYFRSPAFAANATGTTFDPDVLLRKLRENVPEMELLKPGQDHME